MFDLESKLLNIAAHQHQHQHQPLQLLQHVESCSNQMKHIMKDKENTHTHQQDHKLQKILESART
jgi:hypothetical protein